MKKRDLSGRTALVTGGALRIGRSIAIELARAGADIAIHYRSSAREAETLQREIASLGVKAAAFQADFAEDGAADNLLDRVLGEMGGLDILVNSASVFHKDTLRTIDVDRLRSEMRVNLEAPLLLMKAFAERGSSGRIVNLLDTRVAGDDKECLPYLLSKKALRNATRLAALELAPAFTVNAVAPGDVLPPNKQTSDYVQEFAVPSPLDAKPSPEDIAEAVLFLVSMDTISGQVLYVDSGAHLLA